MVPVATSLGRPWPGGPPRSAAAPIIALSNKNRPGLSRLAPMPPTCAARWMTRSGRASASRRRTAARSTRSYSRERGTKTRGAARAQPLDDEAAEEAGAAGDDDPLVLPERAHARAELPRRPPGTPVALARRRSARLGAARRATTACRRRPRPPAPSARAAPRPGYRRRRAHAARLHGGAEGRDHEDADDLRALGRQRARRRRRPDRRCRAGGLPSSTARPQADSSFAWKLRNGPEHGGRADPLGDAVLDERRVDRVGRDLPARPSSTAPGGRGRSRPRPGRRAARAPGAARRPRPARNDSRARPRTGRAARPSRRRAECSPPGPPPPATRARSTSSARA